MSRPLPARVVSVDNNQLKLLAQPQLGCATCERGGGCQGGLLGRLVTSRRGEIVLPHPGFQCAPGETVWLRILPAQLLRIALWTYGLPVLAILLVALILDSGTSSLHWLAAALVAIFAVLAPQRAALMLNPSALHISHAPDGAEPAYCHFQQP